MKIKTRKILGYIILALVYFFPFRYAFLEDHTTDFLWLINHMLVGAGLLVFFALSFTNPGEYERERERERSMQQYRRPYLHVAKGKHVV